MYTLDIPEVFSAKTMKILRSGEAVTKNARIEIVAALHTRFQEKPSPFEYRAVCKRLVEKYPALQDQSDSGYVSDYCAFVVCVCVCACLIEAYACLQGTWKKQLKQKYRNGRRHGKREPQDDSEDDPQGKSKENSVSVENNPTSTNAKKKRRLTFEGTVYLSSGFVYVYSVY